MNGKDRAFPIDSSGGGLTKHEYFAGVALQGLLAHEGIITTRLNVNESAKNANIEALVQLADKIASEAVRKI